MSRGTPPGPVWSGPPDVPEGTDDERWAEALAAVRRRTVRAGRGARDRPGSHSWLAGAAAAIAVLGVVLLVRLLWPGSLLGGAVDGELVGGVAALLGSAGAVIAWRSPTGGSAWGDVRPLLTRDQRRELTAQLRGRAPLDPAREPLVRELARSQGVQPFFLLLFGLQLMRTGTPAEGGTDRWLDVVVLVSASAGLGVQAVQGLRVARFLRAHPEPTAG